MYKSIYVTNTSRRILQKVVNLSMQATKLNILCSKDMVGGSGLKHNTVYQDIYESILIISSRFSIINAMQEF